MSSSEDENTQVSSEDDSEYLSDALKEFRIDERGFCAIRREYRAGSE